MRHSRRTILIAALGTPLARIAESSTRDGLIDWIRRQRNVQGFERMLRANANPNETDDAGLSALYYAAMAKDPAYVRILLKWRADPNFANPAIRWYPLRGALLAENWPQFQMLLDAGADPRITDLVGNNLLHIAAQTNQPDIVLALLQRGVPPMSRNAQGQTFQTYLFITPTHLLKPKEKAQVQRVIDWLEQHHISVERH